MSDSDRFAATVVLGSLVLLHGYFLKDQLSIKWIGPVAAIVVGLMAAWIQAHKPDEIIDSLIILATLIPAMILTFGVCANPGIAPLHAIACLEATLIGWHLASKIKNYPLYLVISLICFVGILAYAPKLTSIGTTPWIGIPWILIIVIASMWQVVRST